MKKATLINKLNKMKIPFSVINDNGYNSDIEFRINGLRFLAGMEATKLEVSDFCREICYDNTQQEMQRRFFTSFNQLLKYASI